MKFDEDDLGLLLKALAFAAHKHRDCRRKDAGATPYINHPIALANILCNEARVTDIEVICAALLHDTVEDTDTTAEDLEREFGASIRDLVLEVSDDKGMDKPARKQHQVDHAAHISDRAKLVKLADKISNLRDVSGCPPAHWDLERRRQYFDWAKQVIDRLRGVHPGLEAIFDEACTRRP
jgi:guanosine-3',5'-bis(diphosphate) 3'-pyrophosphohydrolase